MKGWKITQHSRILKVLFAAILVLSITAIPLPHTSGWWQGNAEASPPAETPEGQLKRRGIVGIVLSVDSVTATSTPTVASSTPSSVMMTVGMRHGNVRVIVPDNVKVHSPLQDDISIMDTIGMKVAILADKPPVDPNAADGDDVVIRTVTAKKIMIVPNEAVRTHGRGLVTEAQDKGKGKGKFNLLGQDGEEQEIEIDDGDDLEEGDDVIFIKRKKGHDNATSTILSLNLHGLQKADHIADRLTKLTDRFLAQHGDSPAVGNLLRKVERFQASVDKRLEKLGEQVQRLEAKGVEFGPKVRDSLSNKGRNDHEGEAPKPDQGKPLIRPSGVDTSTQGQNQGKNVDRKPIREAEAIDCADYVNADRRDIPKECRMSEKSETSPKPTSTSDGHGPLVTPRRGKGR